MLQFLFSTRLPDGREVCVAPVSADAFEENDAHNLGDDSGYFIYEYDTIKPAAGIEILAKIASYDAAMRIIDIFFAVQRQEPARHQESMPGVLLPSLPAPHPTVIV